MIKKYNKFVEDRLVKEDVQDSPEEIKQYDSIPEVEEIPEEEEGGKYIGDQKMARLASMLDVQKSDNGSIEFEGKEINFYSETEKFHVSGKKFNTSEEVIDYLKKTAKQDTKGQEKFESKSYKSRELKKVK